MPEILSRVVCGRLKAAAERSGFNLQEFTGNYIENSTHKIHNVAEDIHTLNLKTTTLRNSVHLSSLYGGLDHVPYIFVINLRHLGIPFGRPLALPQIDGIQTIYFR